MKREGRQVNADAGLGGFVGYVFGALLLGLAVWLIGYYTAVQSQRALTGQGTRIVLTSTNHDKPEVKRPILLGTTTAWIFVYWPDENASEAIPQGQVARIGYLVRARAHNAKHRRFPSSTEST